MQKQENTTPTKPAFKLSGNNSLLTLADGSKFEINIESAFINFMDQFPPDMEITEIRDEILGVLDDFTKHLPEDYNMGRYKSVYAQMNAYSSFFFSLIFKLEGRKHD